MKQNFLWGTATAAYQIEGGTLEGGRGWSVWDAFCRIPGRVRKMHTGDIACDSFHRFPEDVAMMKQLGVNAYRFSIAWSRIQPTGRGEVNPEGITYYNRLIDLLLENDITPFVTLYHWDLPLDLEMAHSGWLNPQIIDDFASYADICFKAFGDRVKHWVTLNEPWCVSMFGYGTGIYPPGRIGKIEPYIVGHHQLLAHGKAVHRFRDGGYSGSIGIVNNSDWREPLTDSPEDRAAAQRSIEFFYGWFSDPVIFGEYPAVMREYLGSRLPQFSSEEQALLKGSVDFLGLNHYTTLYASENPPKNANYIGSVGKGNMTEDAKVYLSISPNWEKIDMQYDILQWGAVPWGLRKLLNWIGTRYKEYPIYVTENGCPCAEPDAITALKDKQRCQYLQEYTAAMEAAMEEDGVDVRGYFYWSLMDNFEWQNGYNKHFGLIRVNPDNLERVPKTSFYTYREIIHNSLLQNHAKA